MTRRRRALLLLGLAVVLGTLAASDIGRREQALRRAVGPSISVVVATKELPAGKPIHRGSLAVRRMPQQYAPKDGIQSLPEVVGLRPRVSVPAGGDLAGALLAADGGSDLRPGERIADLVAIGDLQRIRPGGHVDLLVTRERDGAGGTTRLALEDAEVLAAEPAPTGEGSADAATGRISVALRVTVKQAVYLTAAQNFARELRLLPRGPGDTRHGAAGTQATSSLEGIG